MTAPTTIAAAEAGILARLTAKIAGYGIEPFPGKPADFKLTHQRGAFLVAYRGAEYSETEDTDSVVQARLLRFDINVMARQLRGNESAYTMLELSRVALTGHRIPGFDRLRPQREVFISEKDGVWTYAATFALGTMAAETDEEETDVLLEQITATSSFATSEIPNG